MASGRTVFRPRMVHPINCGSLWSNPRKMWPDYFGLAYSRGLAGLYTGCDAGRHGSRPSCRFNPACRKAPGNGKADGRKWRDGDTSEPRRMAAGSPGSTDTRSGRHCRFSEYYSLADVFCDLSGAAVTVYTAVGAAAIVLFAVIFDDWQRIRFISRQSPLDRPFVVVVALNQF